MNHVPHTDPYPGCRNAIWWWSNSVGRFPGAIESLRNSEVSVDVLIGRCHLGYESVRALDDGVDEILEAARPEFDTTDFRKYLMAVIYGAM